MFRVRRSITEICSPTFRNGGCVRGLSILKTAYRADGVAQKWVKSSGNSLASKVGLENAAGVLPCRFDDARDTHFNKYRELFFLFIISRTG
jgi:hypothetical protein